MRSHRGVQVVVAAVILGGVAAPRVSAAQGAAPAAASVSTAGTDERAAIAVADSLLRALSAGDKATLARLTLDSSVVGGIGIRGGVERVSLRSWLSDIRRTNAQGFTERGFNATARVQGQLAHVWTPYDLYRAGEWSHCGVDVFTLLKVQGAWRVAALLYTIEQPPACAKHPSGPPTR